MSPIELFKKNPNIIVNTDIDGILSGLLLVKYLDCNIVGFSDSKKTVWLDDEHNDLYKNVYIDMFVTEDNTPCLDQHIVAINDKHLKKIKKTGTKFSPQIDDNKVFTDEGFKKKYPFGTVHYLIAVLESEGIHVELPNLQDSVPSSAPNSTITFGDLIHRADDAMQTSLCAYEENANRWWDWLKSKSNNATVINELIAYLDFIRASVEPNVEKRDSDEYKPKIEAKVAEIKAKTKEFFATNYNSKSRSGDGGYSRIVDKKGVIKKDFLKYITEIGSLLGCPQKNIPTHNTHYNTHTGKMYQNVWIPPFEKDFSKNYTFCGHKVFSYAFIYRPNNNRYINFSFTIDMQ